MAVFENFPPNAIIRLTSISSNFYRRRSRSLLVINIFVVTSALLFLSLSCSPHSFSFERLSGTEARKVKPTKNARTTGGRGEKGKIAFPLLFHLSVTDHRERED